MPSVPKIWTKCCRPHPQITGRPVSHPYHLNEITFKTTKAKANLDTIRARNPMHIPSLSAEKALTLTPCPTAATPSNLGRSLRKMVHQTFPTRTSLFWIGPCQM